MSVSRLVIPLAVLLACLPACAVTPRPAPVTIALGCYSVYADNWPPAVQDETGLRSLPTYLALDSTVVGPRGRRIVLPTTWESGDPNARRAYWEEVNHGETRPSLVLTFQGPRGEFVATLQESQDGYAGEGIAMARGAARWPPEVQVTLAGTSCAGLVPDVSDTRS